MNILFLLPQNESSPARRSPQSLLPSFTSQVHVFFFHFIVLHNFWNTDNKLTVLDKCRGCFTGHLMCNAIIHNTVKPRACKSL